jgi:DNA polymerase III delta prime subunit
VIDDLDLASPLLIRECISLLESFYTAAIIFTVTDQTRLPYPLLQRCQNISLSPLSLPKAEEMATAICRKEGLEIGDMQALKELAKKSEGNPRRILNAIEIVKGNTSVLTVEALRIEAVVSNLQSMTGFVTTVVEQDSI